MGKFLKTLGIMGKTSKSKGVYSPMEQKSEMQTDPHSFQVLGNFPDFF